MAVSPDEIPALRQWADVRDLPDVETIVKLFPRLCDDLLALLDELKERDAA